LDWKQYSPITIKALSALGAKPKRAGLVAGWRSKFGSLDAKPLIAALDGVSPVSPEESILHSAAEGSWTHLAAAAKGHKDGLGMRFMMPESKWSLSPALMVWMRAAPRIETAITSWVKMALRAGAHQDKDAEIAPGILEKDMVRLILRRSTSTTLKELVNKFSPELLNDIPAPHGYWQSLTSAAVAAGPDPLRATFCAFLLDKVMDFTNPAHVHAPKLSLTDLTAISTLIRLAWEDKSDPMFNKNYSSRSWGDPCYKIQVAPGSFSFERLWIMAARLSSLNEYERKNIKEVPKYAAAVFKMRQRPRQA
jgi:hypothetical protein